MTEIRDVGKSSALVPSSLFFAYMITDYTLGIHNSCGIMFFKLLNPLYEVNSGLTDNRLSSSTTNTIIGKNR